MLRTNTVETRTLDLIRKLMSDEKFSEFNLVGGTALALKIGHRLSIDIDLFSNLAFSATGIGDHLKATYNPERLQTVTNGVFCLIDNIKLDLIAHQYPLVKNVEIIDGIRTVSLLDIAAMKLNAIFNSGQRLKDFVDMYALLEIFTLNQMLNACRQKYSDLNFNMVKSSIIHHDDIIFLPVDYVGAEIKWPIISERLNNAYANPNITFALPEIIKKIIQKSDHNHKEKIRRRRL